GSLLKEVLEDYLRLKK
nr:Chain B, peptide from Cadherin-23 [Homo sapiens]